MWLRACAFDIVLHTYPPTRPQPRDKTCNDGEEKIDLDKELQVFLLDGSKGEI